MAFSINFLPDPVSNLKPNEEASYGLITIGSFQERFIAPLHYWKTKDYENHWKIAINRIIKNEQQSCLITSMYDPQNANFIIWWPMYRLDENIHIQNNILFFNQLGKPFEINAPFSFVPNHEILTEDGEKISEWIISIKDLESFINNCP